MKNDAVSNSDKIPRGQTPERKAYMKRYHETHPKRDRRIYAAGYRRTHRNQAAAYRALNAERLTAEKAAWYLANRARILAKTKLRSVVNRDSILAYQARYYAENTDKVKSNVRAYRTANPDKKAHCENRRRARKIGNGGSHTFYQRKELFDLLGNVCFYCEAPPPLTIDHNIPFKRGGTDDISNILPACRSCNSKKNTRTAMEFLERMGQTNHAGETMNLCK